MSNDIRCVSDAEQEAANGIWANCYNDRQRLDHIRKHRSQFEFHDLQDLVACVRGRYFTGYASEMCAQ